MIELTGKYTTANIMIDTIEEGALSQINQMTNHIAFNRPIVVMPDCHQGKGSVIGFTMPMSDKVVPNIIGSDIGCGMLSFCIGKTFPMSLELLDQRIRNMIPFGTNVHDNPIIQMEKDFPWKRVNDLARKFLMAAARRDYLLDLTLKAVSSNYSIDWFSEKCDRIGGGTGRHINALGTLGSGNHFIECGIDHLENYWITIHTGSRNFGKRICDYWQNTAKKSLERGDLKEEIDALKKLYSGDELCDILPDLKDGASVNTYYFNCLVGL